MPKTCKSKRNTAGASVTETTDSPDFDPATLSTWHAASLSQLHSLSVAVLQQVFKSIDLSHTGKKVTLSQQLHDTYHARR